MGGSGFLTDGKCVSLPTLVCLNLTPTGSGRSACLTCPAPPFDAKYTKRVIAPLSAVCPNLAPLKLAPGPVWLNLVRANDMGAKHRKLIKCLGPQLRPPPPPPGYLLGPAGVVHHSYQKFFVKCVGQFRGLFGARRST